MFLEETMDSIIIIIMAQFKILQGFMSLLHYQNGDYFGSCNFIVQNV